LTAVSGCDVTLFVKIDRKEEKKRKRRKTNEQTGLKDVRKRKNK
jgi:hypothetical protein